MAGPGHAAIGSSTCFTHVARAVARSAMSASTGCMHRIQGIWVSSRGIQQVLSQVVQQRPRDTVVALVCAACEGMLDTAPAHLWRQRIFLIRIVSMRSCDVGGMRLACCALHRGALRSPLSLCWTCAHSRCLAGSALWSMRQRCARSVAHLQRSQLSHCEQFWSLRQSTLLLRAASEAVYGRHVNCASLSLCSNQLAKHVLGGSKPSSNLLRWKSAHLHYLLSRLPVAQPCCRS